jgi:hypothetical protein
MRVEESVAALRITGDDLDPDEISGLLGGRPSKTHRKGDRGSHIVGPKVHGIATAESGMWTLEAARREPEDMDAQVWEILHGLTSDLGVWRSITARYRVDLFCGLFFSDTYAGLSLSPRSLAYLGERGIELALCIYAGTGDEGRAPNKSLE